MKQLFPVTLLVFLLVIAGNRVWARRCLWLLSVEQKARLLEATAAGHVWPIISLVVSVSALLWLPTAWIPVEYRAGVLCAWATVPLLISVGAAVSTAMRFSRLQLPQRYLRNLRLRMLIFHLALLSLISVITYGLYSAGARLYNESRQSFNRTMQ